MLNVQQIPSRKDNYLYLLQDTQTGITAAVDAGEAEPIIVALGTRRLDLILTTHHHFDHVEGNEALKQLHACEVIGFAGDAARIPAMDRAVQAGDRVAVGAEEAEVLFLSGHTRGHIGYHFAASRALFCGDVVFGMGCGRLFEGTAEDMFASLAKIKALPDDTLIYCAHEYTQANGRFAAAAEPDNPAITARRAEVKALRKVGKPSVPFTLVEEKATNPFLRARNVAEFARLREWKDGF